MDEVTCTRPHNNNRGCGWEERREERGSLELFASCCVGLHVHTRQAGSERGSRPRTAAEAH